MKRSRQNFTLIEILAVSVIIALLAVIGFGSYNYARDKARDAACRSLLKQLEAGLETFKTKYGYYPPSPNNGNYVCLTINNTANPPDRWEMVFGSASGDFTIGCTSTPDNKAKQTKVAQLKTFIQNLDAEVIKGSVVDDVLEDPWGGRIYYRCPGIVNRGSFDLISAGPDGKFVFDDGISPAAASFASPVSDENDRSKRQEFLDKFKDSNGEWLCDDVANF